MRKHLLRGGNIYYAEEIFITQRKYLLRGENIYYAEKIFITQRKYLLRGENTNYAKKIFLTWRKYSPHQVMYDTLSQNVAYNIVMYMYTEPSFCHN